LRLPGGDFAAIARGDEGAPVAICLHGFPDVPRGFTSMLDALAKAGFRAVAPWMRGYAPSTLAGPFDAKRLGADLIELADALSPHAPVVAIGHDWGAFALYTALAERPDRFRRAVALAVPHPRGLASLILRRPAQLARTWYQIRLQLPGAARMVRSGDFTFVEDLWRIWSPGLVRDDAYLGEVKACLAASLPSPIRYYRSITSPSSMRLAMRKIRVPTLLLQGADDGLYAPSFAARQARGFAEGVAQRTEIISGAGHFLHLERPKEVNRFVIDWATAT
jgi:pimeloyl-ACP methyl ester carboxylesterase